MASSCHECLSEWKTRSTGPRCLVPWGLLTGCSLKVPPLAADSLTMTSQLRSTVIGGCLVVVAMVGAIGGGFALGARDDATRTPSAARRMTFAECQASGEYPGGRYAAEFDNGVCTVQRP